MSFKKNTLWNLSGAVLPMIVGIFAIPFIIKIIGNEAFGILSLVWVLIGYLSLFDLGLGRALTQKISEIRFNEEDDNSKEINEFIKTGLFFTLIAGMIGGGGLIAFSKPMAFRWLNISENMQYSVYQSFLVTAIGIPLTTLSTGLRGVLEGYEKFSIVNIWKIVLGISNFLLPVASLVIFGNSLIHMISGLVLARFIVAFGYYYSLRSISLVRIFDVSLSRDKLFKMLAFGYWMTASNIISSVLVVADRFIIPMMVGASLVAFYTVPYDTLMRILVLPAALSSAIFPRISFYYNSNYEMAHFIYKDGLKKISFSMIFICSLIILLSYEGLYFWLGHEFASKSWMIVCVLSVGILFNAIAQMPYSLIQATGDAKSTALLHFAELLIYIPLLFYFLKYFGLIGAAIAWTLRAFFDLCGLFFIAGMKSKKINI